MIQNAAVSDAINLLAQVVSERAELLRANDCEPQRLVNHLATISYQLYACIDPDDLEKQQ